MTASCAHVSTVLTALLFCACVPGCDGEVQSVHIVAQDYRFTPNMVRLASDRPVDLTLFNQGREVHEFESPLLSDRSVVIESVFLNGEPTTPEHLRIAPGKRLSLRLQVPPGTYLFVCKVKGHSGMTGTFIVE
ncbi:MAG TPA: cupredoxin domain-containing protein [Nitrospiraceae bacterium]|nr:cupredoxin domain-containing protein [Nitrospiraceae bacterium]